MGERDRGSEGGRERERDYVNERPIANYFDKTQRKLRIPAILTIFFPPQAGEVEIFSLFAPRLQRLYKSFVGVT